MHAPHIKRILVYTGIVSGLYSLTFVSPLAANSAVVVTAKEVGGNVVFSGGGSLNLTDLSPVSGTNECYTNGYIGPASGIFQIGGTTAGCDQSTIYGPISGPTNFGSGLGDNSSLNSGGLTGINLFFGGLVIPDTYISGANIFGTSTYIAQTFASLGLTPGTYDWVWGTLNPDSYRLVIDNSINNVPGPLPLLGAGAVSYTHLTLPTKA